MPALKTSMQRRFKFGKWEEGTAEYSGRLIEDKGDHLAVSRQKYILEQVTPVNLQRGSGSRASDLTPPSSRHSGLSSIATIFVIPLPTAEDLEV